MVKGQVVKITAAVAGLCLIPFLLSSFYMSILTEILILGIFALSLNILVGYTGLVSLGHAAFFGVGAYTAGYISKNFSTNLFFTLAAAIIAAILVSAVIGFFCTKLSGFYFLMLTLAFSQMIYSLVHQWTSVTGGTNGLSGISKPTLIAGIDFSNSFALYFLILTIFLLIYFSLKRFVSSPLGKILVGIRENETRMKSMGYNTMFYKNLAFVIAGGLGGAAGCLYTYFNSFVSPSDVYWTMSGSVLIMVLVGGAGTMLGPVLGAAFIVILETIISSYIDLWMLIIGTIFILFVIFAPKGIVGITSSLFSQQNLRKKFSPTVVKVKELKREN
jgi:branched-chain amino acid transport system permease protein